MNYAICISSINHSKMAWSNYLDIRLFYHSNYWMLINFHICFSPTQNLFLLIQSHFVILKLFCHNKTNLYTMLENLSNAERWNCFMLHTILSKIMTDKHYWPRHYESIPTKSSWRLKPWMLSPANLSTFMVVYMTWDPLVFWN